MGFLDRTDMAIEDMTTGIDKEFIADMFIMLLEFKWFKIQRELLKFVIDWVTSNQYIKNVCLISMGIA